MKCLLDMDGVLTSFIDAALRLHKINPANVNHAGVWNTWTRIDGMTENDFWSLINQAGQTFWANLEWMPDGKEILHLVESLFGAENVCLCSSPSADPASASGKMKWIAKNLPAYTRRFILTPAKHFLAHAGSVLVDDSNKNTIEFQNAGGNAAIVARPWNSHHVMADLTANILKADLEAMLRDKVGGYDAD